MIRTASNEGAILSDFTYPEIESFWNWVCSTYLPFCTRMFIHTRLVQIYSFLNIWKQLA